MELNVDKPEWYHTGLLTFLDWHCQRLLDIEISLRKEDYVINFSSIMKNWVSRKRGVEYGCDQAEANYTIRIGRKSEDPILIYFQNEQELRGFLDLSELLGIKISEDPFYLVANGKKVNFPISRYSKLV